MKHNKEYLLLSHFRRNARSSLTKISKKTSIPVSTIFDKLKAYEDNIIHKHTSLLNFKKLGYDLKAHILLKVQAPLREQVLRHLLAHQRINSIYRINNGYDYFIEAVFTSLADFDSFYAELDQLGVEDKKEFFVLEDLAREAFLSYEEGFEHYTLPRLTQP